jgi:hypothetical protein
VASSFVILASALPTLSVIFAAHHSQVFSDDAITASICEREIGMYGRRALFQFHFASMSPIR